VSGYKKVIGEAPPATLTCEAEASQIDPKLLLTPRPIEPSDDQSATTGSHLPTITAAQPPEAPQTESVQPPDPIGKNTAAEFAIEVNTNRAGGDYRREILAAGDLDGCKAICASEERCQAFTLSKHRTDNTKSICYLKKGLMPPKRDGCCTSGIKTSTGDWMGSGASDQSSSLGSDSNTPSVPKSPLADENLQYPTPDIRNELMVSEALNTVTVSAGAQDLKNLKATRVDAVASALSGIKLEASPYVGDVGESWAVEHSFTSRNAPFFFKWHNNGLAIPNIAYHVKGAGGAVLVSQNVKYVDIGKSSLFTIDLRELPERDEYVIQLAPTDRAGTPTGAPSNPVTLRLTSPSRIPFQFTQFDVEDIQKKWGMPGLAVALLCPNGQMFEFAAGTRRADSSVKATAGDLWHIGSDTKAMTAAMIGKLVDEGLLNWDDTIWDLTFGPVNLFPELKTGQNTLHSRFQDLTIEHFASHRSGMMMAPDEDGLTRMLENYGLNPTDFRWNIISRLLIRDHDGTVGEWRYGFGNYMLLGVIIERLRGKPYETVMKEELFAPMGMTTAEFGMPTDLALNNTDPWGTDAAQAPIISPCHQSGIQRAVFTCP
jgi:hypothetical protein